LGLVTKHPGKHRKPFNYNSSSLSPIPVSS